MNSVNTVQARVSLPLVLMHAVLIAFVTVTMVLSLPSVNLA